MSELFHYIIDSSERIIGEHIGSRPGPLLIVFGGMHGNEPAGVNALRMVFKMIEAEPVKNPDFTFAGQIVGLIGNVRAFTKRQRFINCDLNRHWIPEDIAVLKKKPAIERSEEEAEIFENLHLIQQKIAQFQPEKIVVLDIHTTTARGGIFSIATDNPESVRIAKELHAPVILNMLGGINGTSLHYFTTENFGIETIPVCFEAGQHDEPLSTSRAIAAIINCMRIVGNVNSEDVETRHNQLLVDYSRGLPKISELIEVHHVEPTDQFKMKPGYKNFQAVEKDEILATNKHGYIRASSDGRVLMPLYQEQGEDGFFLIRDVEE